jgi:hypothetical protein
MLPRILICEECGERAIVKAYLPIYDEQKQFGQATPELDLKAMRCKIDCPQCGARDQLIQPPADN